VILRACTICGKLSEQGRCPKHRPKPWEGSRRREKVTLSGSAQQKRSRWILERDDTICHVCGHAGAREVDHVTPIAEGGADDESNLRPIHEDCHRRKTAREAARGRGR
jgi:5-methylcytosine-specific restriction enzyme A